VSRGHNGRARSGACGVDEGGDVMLSARRVRRVHPDTAPMPVERDEPVDELIDAATVVESIALVARAVVVACERLKNSSGAA